MKNLLWKTTIVIWSDYDPTNLELENLAREAQTGDCYCSRQDTNQVSIGDLPDDPDWDDTEFFGSLTHENQEEERSI